MEAGEQIVKRHAAILAHKATNTPLPRQGGPVSVVESRPQAGPNRLRAGPGIPAVTKPDRLARSLRDAKDIVDELNRREVQAEHRRLRPPVRPNSFR